MAVHKVKLSTEVRNTSPAKQTAYVKVEKVPTEETVRRVLTEDVLTLPQARIQIQEVTGQRPDKSTCIRWILKGTKGVRLEAIKLGNSWITSSQAINRFITAVTEASLS